MKRLLWLSVVTFYMASQIVRVEGMGDGQMCKCASVKPEFHADWEKSHVKKKKRMKRKRIKRSPSEEEDDDDRIVGGYEASHNKPWAAKLWLIKNSFLCGASLINKRYLLTAAHCTCKILKCTAGRPNYNPKEELAAYLGINTKIVEFDNSDIKGNPTFEYGTEDVISHPGYHGTQDIALVKLDRDVKFLPGVVEPICLPLSDDKSDVPKKGEKLNVFVAGWGRTSATCTTNEMGPVKNLKCKFPFEFKGQPQHSCVRSRSPSSKVDQCKAFRRMNPEQYPVKMGDSILITDGSKNTSCHAYETGTEGWCQGIGTDDQFDDNWGWCQPSCRLEKDSTRRLALQLQETHLEILPLAHCKALITIGLYDFVGKYEICAGKKKRFKSVKMFSKQGSGYKLEGEVTNYIGLNANGDYPYDYYIAGTDSCNGDSGGGVYRWLDGVPTLIAVVARGYGSGDMEGCAELNFPGIYTRVSKYLDWIRENTQDGVC